MLSDLFDRILIIGACGQLGSGLASVFADHAPLTPTHAELDLEDPMALAYLLRTQRPTLVLNTAAFHNVPLCEEYPERAFAVNTFSVDRLASLCARSGAFLVHVSTDYVFDGSKKTPYSEKDAASPLNTYGVSKLAGEHMLARHGCRFLIVRTSGLYAFGPSSSLKGAPFIEKILVKAEHGEQLRVVSDMTFSPSYAPHVAWAIRCLLEAGASGTMHVGNARETTWHGFASAALEEAGIHADIEPLAANDAPVHRPRYSVLSLDRALTYGVCMPDWRAGVQEYIALRSAIYAK